MYLLAHLGSKIYNQRVPARTSDAHHHRCILIALHVAQHAGARAALRRNSREIVERLSPQL